MVDYMTGQLGEYQVGPRGKGVKMTKKNLDIAFVKIKDIPVHVQHTVARIHGIKKRTKNKNIYRITSNLRVFLVSPDGDVGSEVDSTTLDSIEGSSYADVVAGAGIGAGAGAGAGRGASAGTGAGAGAGVGAGAGRGAGAGSQADAVAGAGAGAVAGAEAGVDRCSKDLDIAQMQITLERMFKDVEI
jgi:hypothetical protein